MHVSVCICECMRVLGGGGESVCEREMTLILKLVIPLLTLSWV